MRKSVAHIIFLILALSAATTSWTTAQNNVNDFLLSAFYDTNLNQFDSQIRYLNQGGYGVPLISKMELRFDNDKLIKSDQEYALRVKATNPFLLKYNNEVFKASKKELQTEKEIYINENLFLRYELAINYLMEKEASDISRRKLELTNQIVQILTENQQSALFDPEDYVNLKLKQIEAIKSATDTKQKSLLYSQNIHALTGSGTIDWSYFELISVKTIEKNINNIISRHIPSLESKLLIDKIEIARKEYKMEKSDFDLGFFQTKYIPYSTTKSKFGVTFGVNIPLFRPKQNKAAENKLNELALIDELDNIQKMDSLSRNLNVEYLLKLIEEHHELKEQIKVLDIENISKNMSRIQSNNPITHLEMKMGILKLEDLLLQSKKAILEQYLEFLMSYDALSAAPLINHLSENLEPLN